MLESSRKSGPIFTKWDLGDQSHFVVLHDGGSHVGDSVWPHVDPTVVECDKWVLGNGVGCRHIIDFRVETNFNSS